MLTTQVLIIGAGPVGMTAALSLAQAGVQCVVVDKRLERLDAPKAHAVNPRTLEICNRLGVSADMVRANGASVADGGKVHFVDVLTGTCFGSLPYERQDDGAFEFTPWPLVNIGQPKFEQLLSQRLTQLSGVSLLRGASAEKLEQDDEGVEITLRLAGTEADNLLKVRAEYCIAADGAGSPTRESLEIGMTGPEALQHNMMIHFEADLRPLTEAHPGLLYFCMSPNARGAFIGYDRARTWVFMHAYDPNTQTKADFQPDHCKALIQAALGTDLPDIDIKNVSPWTMSAQVADAYQQGRVFLAGDAAHRFPPTGGLGLNTGVADAQNLCWKLSKVLKRSASPGLLATYEQERRPIAQINSHQSLTNSAKLMHLFAAVYGPDPAASETHYADVCADPAAHPAVAEAVEIQRPHFDSFNLQLGYRYGVTVDPDAIDISRYEPSFEVGSYLPHIHLADDGWLLGKLSNNEFSLLTGPDWQAWTNEHVQVVRETLEFQPTTPFFAQAGLQTDGAILVRPDGHICARWPAPPSDPADAVAQCLSNMLAGHLPQPDTSEN